MKKILKKLGVLGLIIAILAPFTKIPVVNAEETTNCPKHLQNYMFLDVNWLGQVTFNNTTKGTVLDVYSNDGYLTRTKYPYVFTQTQNSKITINSVYVNALNIGDKTNVDNLLQKYWGYATYRDASEELYITTDHYYTSKEAVGAVFITESNNSNVTYADNSILFHGVWSNENGRPTNASDNPDFSEGFDVLKATSIQSVIAKNDKNDLPGLKVDIDSAKFENGKFEGRYGDANIQYFQDIVDGKITPNDGNNDVIPLQIIRSIDKSIINFDDYLFGFENENGITIFTEKADGTDINEIDDSYTAYKKYLARADDAEGENYVNYYPNENVGSLDFDITKKYYWPVVLTLEYEVCPLSENEKDPAKWTITYHDNVSDAEITVPAQQTEKVGTNMKTSTTKPERSGYVFQKWCESANGSGQCYTPGQEVASPKEGKDVPLYAIWGATNTVDNPKQGVISYIIGFAAVGVVAGGIYLISKKKNLFKQI